MMKLSWRIVAVCFTVCFASFLVVYNYYSLSKYDTSNLTTSMFISTTETLINSLSNRSDIMQQMVDGHLESNFVTMPDHVQSTYSSNSASISPPPLHSKLILGIDVTNITLGFQKSYYTLILLGRSRSVSCLTVGTNIFLTKKKEDGVCYCKDNWSGTRCSIPKVVTDSNYPHQYGLGYRRIPRRILFAFPYSHELHLVLATLEELSDEIDVFMIVESNYTSSGEFKERHLLKNMKENLLKYRKKIIYIKLDYYPPMAYANGWMIEALHRNIIGRKALPFIDDLRQDDILLVLDADELPVKETLIFLKVHDAYPQPFGFHLAHHVFGFQWLGPKKTSKIFGGCSIEMLSRLLNNETYRVRDAPNSIRRNHTAVRIYEQFEYVIPWLFGNEHQPAGWHCSWCFDVAGIQKKLAFAHSGDWPRWGSDPQKMEHNFIRKLVREGIYFDEKTKLTRNLILRVPSFFQNRTKQYPYFFN